jgi:hypothetical protein
MIHETVIDESLNRLLAHFKARVVVRPPASAAELAELEEMAGPLPRDMTIFYATCNGIRIQLESKEHDAHICSLHEIENVLGDCSSPASALGLALVRGDPDEMGDWLVLEPGPAHGCVIRWNPHIQGATLIASSYGYFVNSWVDYLISQFDHNGHLRLDRTRSKFDADYTSRNDPGVARLRTSEPLQSWLHSLDLAVPTGDDFE